MADDDPCIFDPYSPYITFSVVDPTSGRAVPYDERGQVVMNHVSKNALLPNNLERDTATPPGRCGGRLARPADPHRPGSLDPPR